VTPHRDRWEREGKGRGGGREIRGEEEGKCEEDLDELWWEREGKRELGGRIYCNWLLDNAGVQLLK